MFAGRSLWLMAGLLVLPVAGAIALGGYEQRIMTLAGIYAIAVLGYQLIFGRLGALSLAQGCFFGLGAYVTGLAGVHLDWGFPASFLASLAVPALLAALVAIPVLRLESHYFALATLGISQVALLIGVNWTEVTGGANGLYGVPEIRFPGLSLISSEALLVTVWSVLAAALVVFGALTRGRKTHRLTLLREAPEAAAATGIDIGANRLVLFVASAAFGGAAGALQAHSIGVVSPAVLEFQVMVTILAMTVIGGRGHPAGAILGAILLAHLPEWFRFLESHYLIAYGAALLVAVIAMPEGLTGWLDRWLKEPAPPAPTGSDPHPSRHTRSGIELSLRNLTKSYGGVTAVDGVSLNVAAGEIVGLIGPNGSGKSTLINIASGLQSPENGSVHFGSSEITRSRPHERALAGLARTFQTPPAVPSLAPMAFVLAACPAGMDDGQAEALACGCLERAGLTALPQATGAALSPAQRRGLDLARALASRPSVLLLDEPAAGLTPDERTGLATCLKSLASEGLGLLIVDHSMDFLLPLTDRVVCLATGKVVAEGTPEEVSRDPAAIAAYFGSGDS